MALNPDWNQYSVAPVGHVIIIGHRRAMHSGLTRESALNLLACLIIASEATPEEIAAELERVQSPSTVEIKSPALLRDKAAADRNVVKLKGADGVIEVPATRKVPGVRTVDEGRVKMAWRAPLNATDITSATGTEGEE